MDEPSVEVNVGAVSTNISQFMVKLVRQTSGEHQVRLFINPKDARRGGDVIFLTVEEYEKVKQLFAAVDSQIDSGVPVCPNCKVPPRDPAPADCAFCGYVYQQ